MRRLRGNPWAVLVVISLGFFMTLLDLTIVNIAIPNMITKLHASFDDVLWVINAYALVLAVLVITGGRLGDLIGPRAMFGSGVTVFTAASAACGLAPSPGWLIALPRGAGAGRGHADAADAGHHHDDRSRRSGAARRSVCGERWPVWPPSPGRPWAGCSSPRSTGAGFSSSTCRSA